MPPLTNIALQGGEAGYCDPLDTPGFKVACLVWFYLLWLGIGSQPEPFNLGEGAWASLVVLQPWFPPAFLWCVGVYGEHIDCVFSNKDLEMPVVCAQ